VPLRLSGNLKWGVPVPEKEGVTGQTFYVWPESLWAPMSFLETFLQGKRANAGQTNLSAETSKTEELSGKTETKKEIPANPAETWADWWWGDDTHVYQFIGEDNIYFYAVAEMGLFMALRHVSGREPEQNLPTIISNRHAFFGNKKASSSGAVKPPMALDLLNHYTVEQLRMHFAHMALHSNSASFNPKAVMPGASGFDATLAEGNILTNVYNRIVRSCFYTMQKYFGGALPEGEVSAEARQLSDTLVREYEWAMYKFEFSKIIDLLDVYLRDVNKMWAAKSKEADAIEKAIPNGDNPRVQILLDTFHAVRIADTLLHPFAPSGTETVQAYLNVDDRLWDWRYIEEPLRFFTGEGHRFKFLEPRVDFFEKHPSQLG
jgi:methionyl-tRNA synthetase